MVIPAQPEPPQDGAGDADGTEADRRREAGDEVLLDALATGLSYLEAGELAGLSARTVRRRMTAPDFAAELARRRAMRVSDVTGRLVAASERAVQVLLELLESQVAGERLRSAELILNMGRRFRSDTDIDVRLSTLEARPAQVAARGVAAEGAS